MVWGSVEARSERVNLGTVLLAITLIGFMSLKSSRGLTARSRSWALACSSSWWLGIEQVATSHAHGPPRGTHDESPRPALWHRDCCSSSSVDVVHWLLFWIDREISPRAWVPTAPVDPNLPIRGRYITMTMLVPLRTNNLIESDGELLNTWQTVQLGVEGDRLIAQINVPINT